jgi:hypothetical protein
MTLLHSTGTYRDSRIEHGLAAPNGVPRSFPVPVAGLKTCSYISYSAHNAAARFSLFLVPGSLFPVAGQPGRGGA